MGLRRIPGEPGSVIGGLPSLHLLTYGGVVIGARLVVVECFPLGLPPLLGVLGRESLIELAFPLADRLSALVEVLERLALDV